LYNCQQDYVQPILSVIRDQNVTKYYLYHLFFYLLIFKEKQRVGNFTIGLKKKKKILKKKILKKKKKKKK